MKVVNIHEAKTHLSTRVQEAIDGEEVVIASERTPGWAAGQVKLADDFDAPLDDFADYR